ncbi:HAD family hydrolase [Actinomadura sp. WMMA1423]|uniref:HAD family hydrolase n=1 Tax=Actinomadura sp. WMMA1423 TaxID=2591108 RepID=UPI0011478662|nr:HAD family hydrolase [Actinomadura sp. WMMA1423]
MTVLVCSDLDRTLIYSTAAFALDGPDETMPRLLCVEFYQGAPLSYMTEASARALEALARASAFVPTTTRTPEQYRRVHLLEKPPPYAICANGGHILVDGEDDPDWAAAVRERVAEGCAPLADVQHHLAGSGGEFVLKRRTASDLFAYTVVDRAALPPGWVEDLTGWCAERGWRTSLQGRKVYCLPAGLTKAAAAREVARRAGASTMIAAGDALLDAELLEAADLSIRPAHGELHDTGWTAAATAVTAARGIAAGEEIALWLLDRAAAPQIFTGRARGR